MLTAPLLDENYSVNQPIKNEQNEQNEKNQQQLYNTSNYESNWCIIFLVNCFVMCCFD